MTLLVILAVLAVTGCLGQEWQLIWEDNFDGDSIDPTKWDHEVTAWGGGNSEFQLYTDDPANSYVRDGKLFILPSLLENNINPLTGAPFGSEFMTSGILDVQEMYGRCTNNDNNGCYRTGAASDIPPTMSARLRTADRFYFTFGRVEILAKMPNGDWMWPAMWMLPEFWVYGDWPVSGESDITESIGNPDFVNPSDGSWYGLQKMGATLHWGTSSDQNRWYLTNSHYINATQNYGDFFHLYEMQWDENGFTFFIDGMELVRYPDPLINENPDWVDWYTYGGPWNPPNDGNPWSAGTNMAPFDEDFHFLLNVAIGGTNGFIPDDGINRGGAYPKPWSNSDWYVDAMNKFYDARADWLWTWYETQGENSAMQVDYVRVYQQV